MDGHTKGHIEVICGPMFSGKSEELIRRIRRVLIAKKKALVFKSAIDTRYDNVDIVSHNGSKLEAIPIPKNDINKIVEEVKKRDKENFLEVIGIDEAQFFGDEIVNIAERFAEEGRRVIISGLDKDFRGEPFGPMPQLLCIADYVTKLNAICSQCGDIATKTQRIVNGKIPHYDDPVELVGASEKYEARCRVCHKIRGKPK